MRTLVKFLVCSLVFFVYSCTTISKTGSSDKEKEVMDSWVGSTKAILISQWGPPTRVADDGQGGEILVYDKTAIFPQMGYVYSNPYNSSAFYTNSQNNVVTRSRMFYVNDKGIIYHWLAQGRVGY